MSSCVVWSWQQRKNMFKAFDASPTRYHYPNDAQIHASKKTHHPFDPRTPYQPNIQPNSLLPTQTTLSQNGQLSSNSIQKTTLALVIYKFIINPMKAQGLYKLNSLLESVNQRNQELLCQLQSDYRSRETSPVKYASPPHQPQNHYQAQLNELQEKNKQLVEDLNFLNLSYKELKLGTDELNQKNQQLKKHIKDLLQALKHKDDELKKLREKAKNGEPIDDPKSQDKSIVDYAIYMERQFQTLEDKVKRYKKMLEKNGIDEKFAKKVDDQRKALHELAQEKDTLLKQKEEISGQLLKMQDQLRASVELHHQEIALKNSLIEKLNGQIIKQLEQQSLEDIKQINHALQNKLNDLERQNKELDAYCKQSNLAAQEQFHKIQSLNKDLNQSAKEVQNLKQQVAVKDEEYSRLIMKKQKEIAFIKQQEEQRVNELLQSRDNQSELQYNNILSKFNNLQIKIVQLEDRNKYLKSRFSNLLKKLIEQVQLLKGDISSLHEQALSNELKYDPQKIQSAIENTLLLKIGKSMTFSQNIQTEKSMVDEEEQFIPNPHVQKSLDILNQVFELKGAQMQLKGQFEEEFQDFSSEFQEKIVALQEAACQQLHKQRDDMTAQMEELKSQIESLIQELNNQSEQIYQLENDNQQLRSGRGSEVQQGDLESHLSELKGNLERLQRQQQDDKGKLKSLAEENQALKDQIQRKEMEQTELSKKLSSSEQQVKQQKLEKQKKSDKQDLEKNQFKQVSNELDQTKSQLKQVQLDYGRLKETSKNFQSEVVKLKQENQNLKQQVEQLQNVQSQLDKANKDILTLTGQIRELSATSKEWQNVQQEKEMLQQLNPLLKQVREELEAKNAENAQLRNSLDLLTVDYQNAQEDIASYQEQNEELQEQLALIRRVNEGEPASSNGREQVEQATRVEQLTVQIQTLLVEKERLKNHQGSLEENLSKAHQQLKQQQEVNTQQKEDLDMRAQKTIELQYELQRLKEEIQRLSAVNEQEQSDAMKELLRQLKQKDSELSRLQDVQRKQEGRCQSLEDEIIHLRAEQAQANGKIENLEYQVANWRAEINEKSEQLSSRQKDLESKNAQVRSLNEALLKSQSDIKALEDERLGTQNLAQRQRAQIEKLEDQVAQLEAAKSNQTKESQLLNNKVTEGANNNAKLEEAVAEQKTQILRQKNEIESLKEELEKVNRDYQEREQQLQGVKTQQAQVNASELANLARQLEEAQEAQKKNSRKLLQKVKENSQLAEQVANMQTQVDTLERDLVQADEKHRAKLNELKEASKSKSLAVKRKLQVVMGVIEATKLQNLKDRKSIYQYIDVQRKTAMAHYISLVNVLRKTILKIKELRRDYAQIQNDVAKFQIKIDPQLPKAIQQLYNQFDSENQNLAHQANQAKKRMEEALLSAQQKQKEIEMLELKNADQQKHVASLKSNLDGLQDKTSAQFEEISHLKSEHIMLQGQISQQAKEIDGMAEVIKQIPLYQQRVAQLESQKINLNQIIQDLESKIAGLQSQYSMLQEQNKELISKQDVKAQDLLQRIQKKEQALHQEKQHNQLLIDRLQVKNDEIEGLKLLDTKLKREIEELQSQNEDLQDENEQLKQASQRYQVLYSERDEKLQQLNETVYQQKQQISEREKKITLIQNDIDGYKKRQLQLEKKLQMSDFKLHRGVQLILQKISCVKIAPQQIQDLIQQMSAVKSQCMDSMAAMQKQYNKQISKLQKELEETQHNYEVELAKAKRQLTQSTKRYDEMFESQLTLTSHNHDPVMQIKEQLDKQLAENDRLKAELDRLQAKFDEFNNRAQIQPGEETLGLDISSIENVEIKNIEKDLDRSSVNDAALIEINPNTVQSAHTRSSQQIFQSQFAAQIQQNDNNLTRLHDMIQENDTMRNQIEQYKQNIIDYQNDEENLQKKMADMKKEINKLTAELQQSDIHTFKTQIKQLFQSFMGGLQAKAKETEKYLVIILNMVQASENEKEKLLIMLQKIIPTDKKPGFFGK